VNVSAEDLTVMSKALTLLGEFRTDGDHDRFAQVHERFHATLYAASGSPKLIHFVTVSYTHLAETPPAVMGLFPGANFFSFLSHDGTEAGGLGPIMMAHAWIPKTPALHELVSWVLVERDASQELRELTRRATIRTFGISGIIEQDDAEAWRGVQRSVGGPMGRRSTGKYNARLGINRPDDFEGGGDVYAGTSRDDAQWAWWSRYFDVMTS